MGEWTVDQVYFPQKDVAKNVSHSWIILYYNATLKHAQSLFHLG